MLDPSKQQLVTGSGATAQGMAKALQLTGQAAPATKGKSSKKKKTGEDAGAAAQAR